MYVALFVCVIVAFKPYCAPVSTHSPWSTAGPIAPRLKDAVAPIEVLATVLALPDLVSRM